MGARHTRGSNTKLRVEWSGNGQAGAPGPLPMPARVLKDPLGSGGTVPEDALKHCGEPVCRVSPISTTTSYCAEKRKQWAENMTHMAWLCLHPP